MTIASSTPSASFPTIIQGGMGAGVSNWRLANAVSSLNQLGVVSGTALDLILARRLQDGDPGGHMRRAMQHFPFHAMAERVKQKYFRPEGKPADEPYMPLPMPSHRSPREWIELCIVANFVEVFLAREGHPFPVGINFLEKVQVPHLPSLYGSMLAGVGYVLMGAGIPHRIPGVLDSLSRHEPVSYSLYVTGAKSGEETLLTFDPKDYMEMALPPLTRPKFLPIIASNTLAIMLIKKSNGPVDGFIIEGPTAGGHNAPPRGAERFSESGEPIYGERDVVDFSRIKELGLPFWIAGGYATSEKLREALAAGAAGIQVGTAFALCEESGLRSEDKTALLHSALHGTARIFTDPRASPTGFPFKIALMPQTLSEAEEYQARTRICDLGYLREAYRKDDGEVGYRCASEPIDTYVAKGGEWEDTTGRKCLCNALLANIGHPQSRLNNSKELSLITCGDDLATIGRFLSPGHMTYTARDVVTALLATT